MKINTIDVYAKEWFDKVNGNSYFSAEVVINYGRKNSKAYTLPFQYGYGDHYMDMVNQYLIAEGLINPIKHPNGMYEALWAYCKDNKIILRKNKQEGCLKRELTHA